MKYAGFWRRSLAYMFDILPVTLVMAVLFYFYFGFDEIVQARLQDKGDIEARKSFLQMRNWIRDLSFLIWLGYCFVMEASPMQGTIGKYLLGIKVVDQHGERLSYSRSFLRASTKLASYAALSLGFLWVAFTKQKQGWHDKAAQTFVICKKGSVYENEPFSAE